MYTNVRHCGASITEYTCMQNMEHAVACDNHHEMVCMNGCMEVSIAVWFNTSDRYCGCLQQGEIVPVNLELGIARRVQSGYNCLPLRL